MEKDLLRKVSFELKVGVWGFGTELITKVKHGLFDIQEEARHLFLLVWQVHEEPADKVTVDFGLDL